MPAAAPETPAARMTLRIATGVPALDEVWPFTSRPVTCVPIAPTTRVATFGEDAAATTPVSASGAKYPPA